jgi:uncharacterized delta-60 repeat protein
MRRLCGVSCGVARRCLILLVAPAVLAIGVAPAQAAPGDLDTGFGSGGVVQSQFAANTPPYTSDNDVVADSEGRLYVSGETEDAAGNGEVFVARYTATGGLDPSFGANGVTVLQLGQGSSPDTGGNNGQYGRIRLALDPEGRVLVETDATDVNGNTEMAVLRLTSSGDPDVTFGSGGVVRQQLSDNSSSPETFPFGIAVQPDGDVVLTGDESNSNGDDEFFAERLLGSNGAPDPGFGSDGVVKAPGLGSGSSPSSDGTGVVVQPDGKLVFSAFATDSNGNEQFAITRLDSNGTPDSTFGTDGVTYVQPSPNTGTPNSGPAALVLESSGDIVLAGSADDASGQNEVALVRLTSSGALDTSFGSGGVFLDQLAPDNGSDALGLTVQANNRIVVVGVAEAGLGSDAALIRLLPNGALVSSFGSGGVVSEDFGSGTNPSADSYGATITPDGQLVQAGVFNTSDGGWSGYLAKNELDTPPAVAFSYSPASPVVGQAVRFTATATPSPAETISSIAWDLGSGSLADGSGSTVTKTFTAPGKYTIRAQATDDDGFSTIVSQTLTVGAKPAAPPPPKLKLGKVTTTGSGIKATLSCTGAAGTVCDLSAQLSTKEKLVGSKVEALAARKKKGRKHSEQVAVGSGRFSVPAGKVKTVTVSLNGRGKKLLAKFGHLPVTLKISLLNTKPATVVTRKATIKPKKKRKKAKKPAGDVFSDPILARGLVARMR